MIEIDPRNGKILQQIDLNKVENPYPLGHSQSYNARTIFLGRNGRVGSLESLQKKDSHILLL
jgi:hypothetical protein